MKDFGELRSALNRAPSVGLARTIFKGVQRAWVEDPRETEEVWLPYALEHMSRWPRGLRRAHSMLGDVEHLGPWLVLCEELDLLAGRHATLEIVEMLQSPWVRHLESLRVCPRGDARPVLEALWSAPHLGPLRSLAVEHAPIEVEDLQILLESFPGLEALRLNGASVGTRGANLIAACAEMSGLKTLELWNNTIEDDGVASLAASPNLNGLVELTLGDNLITDRSLDALARAPFALGLRRLALARTNLSLYGLERFVTCDAVRGLRSLDLNDTSVSDDVVEALVGGDHASALRDLWLDGPYLTDRGALAIANSPHLGDLEMLGVDFSRITGTGFVHLLRSGTLSSLSRVDTNECDLDRLAAELPSDRSSPTRFDELDLYDPGAPLLRALAHTRRMAGLRSLDLAYTDFDDEKMRAFLSTDVWGGLEVLDLSHATFGSACVRLLADYPFDALQSLNMEGVELGADEEAALRTAGLPLVS